VRIDQELHAARAKFEKELDCLLELLAARRRLCETQARKPDAVLQQGETAEADAVLAALQRVGRRRY
jgi:hypothetical protein